MWFMNGWRCWYSESPVKSDQCWLSRSPYAWRATQEPRSAEPWICGRYCCRQNKSVRNWNAERQRKNVCLTRRLFLRKQLWKNPLKTARKLCFSQKTVSRAGQLPFWRRRSWRNAWSSSENVCPV